LISQAGSQASTSTMIMPDRAAIVFFMASIRLAAARRIPR
jgi:hypothetical protein